MLWNTLKCFRRILDNLKSPGIKVATTVFSVNLPTIETVVVSHIIYQGFEARCYSESAAYFALFVIKLNLTVEDLSLNLPQSQ
jgi:hypothetical protein